MTVRAEFGEAQLQQWVNDGIHSWTGRPAFMVSLREEYDRGWDTAFELPGLGQGAADQLGCNFFIQYKLSDLLGPKGGQAADWGGPYFRFRIPSDISNSAAYVVGQDYHQFDRLKELSDKGFVVCYLTNSVLSIRDLLLLYDGGHILQSTPALALSLVRRHHEYVTFRRDSKFFLLHSEPERVVLQSVLAILSGPVSASQSTLAEVVSAVEPILSRFEQEVNPDSRHSFRRAIAIIEGREGRVPQTVRKALVVGTFLYRYLNTIWVRLATQVREI